MLLETFLLPFLSSSFSDGNYNLISYYFYSLKSLKKKKSTNWNGEVLAVEKCKDAESPNDPEDGGQLHQVLLGQMIARVQLEDQDVVHTGRSRRKIKRSQVRLGVGLD